MTASPGPHRGVATIWAVLSVAVIALGSVVSVPAPARAQAATEAVVTLIDQTTWVAHDGEIVVRISLDDVPSDATVEVTLHERMRSRSDFLATLDRERLRGRLTDPPMILGTGAELGSTATARIPIRSGPQDPEVAPRLGIADPGIHPVDIAVYSPERTYLGGFVTHIVRLPVDPEDQADPLGVVLAGSLDAGLSHRPDGTILLDQSTREAWTVAVDALPAAGTQPMVLAVRPETVAALASSSSPLDRALLDELVERVEHQTLAAQTFVALDLDGLVGADLVDELQRQIELGSDQIEGTIGMVDRGTWVADANLTDRALEALADMGIERLVVPRQVVGEPQGEGAGSGSDDFDPDDFDPDGFDPDRPLLGAVALVTEDGTQVAALATDPYLQQHQGRTGDPRLDAQHALIDLAMLGAQAADTRAASGNTGAGATASVGATSGVLTLDLTPDPAERADPLFVSTLLEGLDRSPSVVTVSLDQAIGRTASLPRRHVATAPSTGDLSSLRRDLNLARLSVASFDAVFPRPVDPGDPLPGDVDFDRLLAVVVSSRLEPDDRAAYFATIADVMQRALDGIAVHARAITLPARDGTVPITLTNDSGRDALVIVRLDSDRLDFPLGPRIEVPLPPGSTTVEIAVRARASGAFPLDIEVESPDGRIALAASRYTVRSTAVSGVGVAISVAAIVVLGVWWVRTARRARAARADLVDQGRSPTS